MNITHLADLHFKFNEMKKQSNKVCSNSTSSV
ncbi:hypothetical protein D918_06886 [Trichuris suis]|nr:hypothetical protein D918_06886 [Trichuris suis]